MSSVGVAAVGFVASDFGGLLTVGFWVSVLVCELCGIGLLWSGGVFCVYTLFFSFPFPLPCGGRRCCFVYVFCVW